VSNQLTPRLQQWTDFPEYNRAVEVDEASSSEFSNSAEAAVMDDVNTRGFQAFQAAHPEFYASEWNIDAMDSWLFLNGEVPATRWNLEIAQRELTASGLLQLAPVEPPGVDKWASIVEVRSDVLARYVPSDREAAALAKLADDPNLNDHQRKVRLKKLAQLAGAQRRYYAGQ
jgi:hypothetical protein